MPEQLSFRGYLEIDNGNFCCTEKILESPELQKRCIEQRELKKIMRKLEKHNPTPADLKDARTRLAFG